MSLINVKSVFEPCVIDVRKIMQEAESERFYKELYRNEGEVYFDGDRGCFIRETVIPL